MKKQFKIVTCTETFVFTLCLIHMVLGVYICPKGTYMSIGYGGNHDTLADCKICAAGKYNDEEGKILSYAFAGYHTFTNCGATGKNGPQNVAACTNVGNDYNGITWATTSTIFDITGDSTAKGIQVWTVPETATYYIYAYGAKGGDDTSETDGGGKGAFVTGSTSSKLELLRNIRLHRGRKSRRSSVALCP